MMIQFQSLLGDGGMTMSHLGLSFLMFQNIFNSLYLHLLLPESQNIGKLHLHIRVQVALPTVVRLVATHNNNN